MQIQRWVGMIILFALWFYILTVLRRARLQFWHFLVGSIGLFCMMMFFVSPHLAMPMARVVSVIAGLVGDLTGTFEAFFKYGIIYIATASESLTLKIDFECSGCIEIFAFLSLLIFFDVYSKYEKIVVGILGVMLITLTNAIRIVMICESFRLGGLPAYYFTHTFIGRIFFYIVTVGLYFYVFTKPQVIKMKVGDFNYGHDSSSS